MLQKITNRIKSEISKYVIKIQISHRLDYKKPIYLCDNVRLASCSKEPLTVKWIETFQKEDTVFDIGANAGAYSLIMALYCKHVYAIEPASINYALLCKNISLNVSRGTIQNNVTPLNIALSDKNGLETLNYNSTELGTSGQQIVPILNPVFSQKVICFTLDYFITLFNINTPTHLKIDVDGIELAILEGSQQLLANMALKSVMVEMNGDSNSHLITKLLTKNGFKVYDFMSLHGLNKNVWFVR